MNKRKEHLVKQLLQADRTAESCENEVTQIIDMLHQEFQTINKEEVDQLKEKYSYDALFEELKDLFEDFTEEELQQIINFWSSDVGLKIKGNNFQSRFGQVIGRWFEDLRKDCYSFAQEKNDQNTQTNDE